MSVIIWCLMFLFCCFVFWTALSLTCYYAMSLYPSEYNAFISAIQLEKKLFFLSPLLWASGQSSEFSRFFQRALEYIGKDKEQKK